MTFQLCDPKIRSMNAKLDLDEDVMAHLRTTMGQTGRSLAEVVNSLLRGAFAARGEARVAAERKPFEVKARPMGVHPHLDYSRISDLLERLEGPSFR